MEREEGQSLPSHDADAVFNTQGKRQRRSLSGGPQGKAVPQLAEPDRDHLHQAGLVLAVKVGVRLDAADHNRRVGLLDSPRGKGTDLYTKAEIQGKGKFLDTKAATTKIRGKRRCLIMDTNAAKTQGKGGVLRRRACRSRPEPDSRPAAVKTQVKASVFGRTAAEAQGQASSP